MVIIIGVVCGIGCVFVECYIVEGVMVVIVDINEEVVCVIVVQIGVYVIVMDVMKQDSIDVGVVEVVCLMGGIDIFINNVVLFDLVLIIEIIC